MVNLAFSILLFYHQGEKDQILDRQNEWSGEKGSATMKTPGDLLKLIHGRPVVIKLNFGVDYQGQSPYFLFV